MELEISKLAALQNFLSKATSNIESREGLMEALKKYRRRMQRHPTRSEAKFKKILTAIKGLGFIRNQKIILIHKPLKGYILDFYIDNLQLAFEIDGEYHETPKQKKYDEERTTFLNLKGIKVVRVPNRTTNDEQACLEIINNAVNDRRKVMMIRERIRYGKHCSAPKITHEEIEKSMQAFLENGGVIQRPGSNANN